MEGEEGEMTERIVRVDCSNSECGMWQRERATSTTKGYPPRCVCGHEMTMSEEEVEMSHSTEYDKTAPDEPSNVKI